MAVKRKDALVFVSTRIPASLRRDMDNACVQYGMKKQALVARAIRTLLPLLPRPEKRS